MRILRALGDFFSDLAAGDPVAWTVTLVFLAIALGIGLFWYKTARDLRREDEERKRKRSGGQKKDPKR